LGNDFMAILATYNVRLPTSKDDWNHIENIALEANASWMLISSLL